MGKLIYAMITSLDGYTEANEGGIGSSSDDPEVHSFIGEAFRHVGTYLYGRRMYETMVFWETVHQQPDVPAHILEYGEIWRSANKIVYSTTLKEVSSEKTRIEREFDRSMSMIGDNALFVQRTPWIIMGDWWTFRNRPPVTEDLAPFLLATQSALGQSPPDEADDEGLWRSARDGDWTTVLQKATLALRSRLTGEA